MEQSCIVNVNEIKPLSLPSVSLSERNHLPATPAIYFVVSDTDEMLYIGKAINLYTRWSSHHRTKQLTSFSCVKICWLTLDGIAPDGLTLLEEECIERFKPVLNATIVPCEFGEDKNPEIRVYPQTRKTLKIIAAQLGETMQDTVERLAQAEMERLRRAETTSQNTDQK